MMCNFHFGIYGSIPVNDIVIQYGVIRTCWNSELNSHVSYIGALLTFDFHQGKKYAYLCPTGGTIVYPIKVYRL